MPQLDTLVVPIGGGGLISGIAVAAKALKPELRIVGVQAELYPSMYNVIKGEHLPMRGDTLAEGIAVKAPGRITTEIIRRLVDDIVLVTEDQIERAVAMLIDDRKDRGRRRRRGRPCRGAGGAGAFRRPQCRPRADRRQHRHAADRLGADPRTRARGTAHANCHRHRRPPGQLAAVSALSAEAGANIIEVSHQRTFSDLPAKGTLLEVVIETRDRAHLDEVMKRLGEAGYTAWLPGRR